jgi:hypothetical protein
VTTGNPDGIAADRHSLNGLYPVRINVLRTTTGVSGGNYTFALAPVPEPASYAMLLAGLGIMGGGGSAETVAKLNAFINSENEASAPFHCLLGWLPRSDVRE